MSNISNSNLKVPVGVILAIVNGTHTPDVEWFAKLWKQRKAVRYRWGHLRGKTAEDFSPTSWVEIPNYWVL